MTQLMASNPAWLVAVRTRQAILWIAPSFSDSSPTTVALLSDLLALPWAAVYADAEGLDSAFAAVEAAPRPDGLVVRLIAAELPQRDLPPNRLPVFLLRPGAASARAHGSPKPSAPSAMLLRLSKLSHAPQSARYTFAVGAHTTSDLAALVEAQNLSPAFENLVVVGTDAVDLESSGLKNAVQWQVALPEFCTALPRNPDAKQLTRLLIGPEDKRAAIDVTDCIDPMSPISRAFGFVREEDVLGGTTLGEHEIRRYFEDPASSWAPYCAGLPWPRHAEYVSDVQRRLKAFRTQGPAASFTGWIRAANGSGATTVLRNTCYALAQVGIPVLVAHQDVEQFDFRQLSVFLTQANERVSATLGVSDVPWILAFDAVHTLRHWDFVAGVCSGLRNLQRSVVVIAIQPSEAGDLQQRNRALGENRNLGRELSNSVSVSDGVAIGQHLSRILPAEATRRPKEWEEFIGRTLVPRDATRRSLFWLALRFWLFRNVITEEPFRIWLARKLQELVAEHPAASAAILETAVLSRFRLTLPVSLMTADSRVILARIAASQDNVLGVRTFEVGLRTHYTFAHPLIAEEVLHAAANDAGLLASVGMSTCLNTFDLELHLLGRILSRPNAGWPECLPLIEEIATSALRVDPRISPRNYAQRDRIVALFEAVPNSVWDASQVFNHHVAIARRHLAVDPVSSEWGLDARREQLALAAEHIVDALENIRPENPHSIESPINMRVSLALTYDAQARIETHAQQFAAAEDCRRKASAQYEKAQQLDAENLYVLENFARFKLHRARAESAPASRVRLIIEAIAMLELERDVDSGARRDDPVIFELSRAYDMLGEGRGREWLTELASTGNEAAIVALARLTLGTPGEPPSNEALFEARDRLESIDPAVVTWRSRSLLYRVISDLQPLAFAARLELLRSLSLDTAFYWPMQMRLEYAILLFQAGDPGYRQDGQRRFAALRSDVAERRGSMEVPREMRFLADPATGYQQPLRTTITVKKMPGVGRTAFGVPRGWGALEVAFRPQLFPIDRIRAGQELDCLVQFTNFGPQAVPTGTRSEA